MSRARAITGVILIFSEVLLALRDVDLREGHHVGSFPRGGPLPSFQGNIPDLMNDTCEDLSVIPPNPKGNEQACL